jgi:hypothetical protein
VLRKRRRQRHSASYLTVEGDLEGVGAGAGKRNVEDEHGAGFHVHYTGGRLAELHRALAAEELGAGLVHEPDPDRVDPDLGAPPPNPEDQVGTGADGGEVGQPHVLEDAQDAQLPLLVYQRVIGDQREVEMQLRIPGWN